MYIRFHEVYLLLRCRQKALHISDFSITCPLTGSHCCGKYFLKGFNNFIVLLFNPIYSTYFHPISYHVSKICPPLYPYFHLIQMLFFLLIELEYLIYEMIFLSGNINLSYCIEMETFWMDIESDCHRSSI